MKARDYLVSKGLAKQGRGRMSREAHEALKAALAEGMIFSDYTPTGFGTTKVTMVQNGSQRPVQAKVVSESPAAPVIPRESPRTIMEGASISMLLESGKKIKISERAACGSCQYSLSHHVCNTPQVLAPDASGFRPVLIG